MAAGGRRPTFEDFYGDLERAERKDKSGSIVGQGKKQSASRSSDTRGADDEDKVFRADLNSENGDSTTRGVGISGGYGTSGRSDNTSSAGGMSGTGCTSGAAGTSGNDRIPPGGQRTQPIGISKIKTEHPGNLINVEWQGGSEKRIYRRSQLEARKMTIESCEDGIKVKRTEGEVLSEPTTVCNWCRKTSSEPLKRCARCLAVSYCNKECQRAGFKNHKTFCLRCDRYDIARARVYPAVRFFLDLRHAKDYNILLNAMPNEDQYNCGALCNVLVEVLGQFDHVIKNRYSCLVSDLSGTVARVIVHDETNVYRHPSTDRATLRSGDLKSFIKPGSFLLLVNVYWRVFMDGRPGIRINDLDSVYVISMEDQDFPKGYREAMEKVLAMRGDLTQVIDMKRLLQQFFGV